MKFTILILFFCTFVFAAYIQPKKVIWDTHPDADVTTYRVCIVDKDAPVITKDTPTCEDVAVPIVEYILPGNFTIADGTYRIGVFAIDNMGNVSNLSNEVVYTFDFTPPAAVTSVAVGNI